MIKSQHQINDVETDRNLYIGGSDLPTIMRLNDSYGKSIIQFAKEKLKILPNEFKGNEYTKYGQLMEPIVRRFINASLEYEFVEDSITDESRMYRGNCDGIDKSKHMLLEIKTFAGKLNIKMYEPQCQFYMELFDIEECFLVGYERFDNFYTGLDFALEHDDCYFNTEFDPERIVIYKLKRNRDMFKQIEIEINKFKYLLRALTEEEVLNERFTKYNSVIK